MNNQTSELNAHNALVLQGFMVTDFGLSGDELLAFAVVYGACQSGGSKVIPLSYFCAWTGKGRASVRRALRSLEEAGLIEARPVMVERNQLLEYSLGEAVRGRYEYVDSEENYTVDDEEPPIDLYETFHQAPAQTHVENSRESGNSTPLNANQRPLNGFVKLKGVPKSTPVPKSTGGPNRTNPQLTKNNVENSGSKSLRGFQNRPGVQIEQTRSSASKKQSSTCKVDIVERTEGLEKSQLSPADGFDKKDGGSAKEPLSTSTAAGEKAASASLRIKPSTESRPAARLGRADLEAEFSRIRDHAPNTRGVSYGLDAYRRLRESGHAEAEIADALDRVGEDLRSRFPHRPAHYFPHLERLLDPAEPDGVGRFLGPPGGLGGPPAGTAGGARRDEGALFVAALDMRGDVGLEARRINDALVALNNSGRGRSEEARALRRERSAFVSRNLEAIRAGEGS